MLVETGVEDGEEVELTEEEGNFESGVGGVEELAGVGSVRGFVT
jgi:hypothetical protein